MTVLSQLPITKLLTPLDVAEILGVSPGTLSVWRSTKRYDLPYIKSGRLVRYRQADVEHFIATRARGGTQEAGVR